MQLKGYSLKVDEPKSPHHKICSFFTRELLQLVFSHYKSKLFLLAV